jgi:nitroreductase
MIIDEIESKHNNNEVERPDAIYLYSKVNGLFSETDINFFESVICSRKSVRRFSSTKIKKADLESAVSLALQSPSACNRQPWFVIHLSKKTDVVKVLEIQNGNISLAENVNELLVIWMDVSRALSPEERGQHFFDGGLFSMNLANGLHVRGISSCFLNWAKARKDDDALRKYLNISVNYKPVTFLAIGYADQNCFVCRSARKLLENSYISI